MFDEFKKNSQIKKAYNLIKEHKYQEALKAYDKALELDSNYIKALHNKGTTYGVLGKDQEALNCFDKEVLLDPNSIGAWYSKGIALKYLNRLQEALKSFDKALKLDPNFELALNAKNEILEAKKQ